MNRKASVISFCQRISVLSILLSLGFLQCSNPLKDLDTLNRSKVESIDNFVKSSIWNSTKPILLPIKKNESLFIWKNDQNQILRLNREISDPIVKKTFEYYFKDNKLVSSKHSQINTAKVKNKVWMEIKQYYFSEEKTIFASQKDLTFKENSEENYLKLERRSPKKLNAPSNIFNDEMVIIGKLKTFIK